MGKTMMYPCWQPSSNYAEITIDHTKLTGDVTDLVIPLTGRDLSAGFWSAVDAAGLSIVVTDAHSNRILRRQVPHIDKVGETLEVYVRVPRISASMDTDLLLSVAPYTLAQDMLTWPSSWVFASDMSDDDAGTGILDWSRFGNHGTKGVGAEAPTEVGGLVGMAQGLDARQRIVLTTPITLSPAGAGMVLLFRQREAAEEAYSFVLSGGADYFKALYITPANTLYLEGNTNDHYWGPIHDAGAYAIWHSYVVSADTSVVTNYLDNVPSAPQSPDVDWTITTIGTWAGSTRQCANVDVCEWWVRDEPFSPSEIAAIDAALRGSATFYGVTNHF